MVSIHIEKISKWLNPVNTPQDVKSGQVHIMAVNVVYLFIGIIYKNIMTSAN